MVKVCQYIHFPAFFKYFPLRNQEGKKTNYISHDTSNSSIKNNNNSIHWVFIMCQALHQMLYLDFFSHLILITLRQTYYNSIYRQKVKVRGDKKFAHGHPAEPGLEPSLSDFMLLGPLHYIAFLTQSQD